MIEFNNVNFEELTHMDFEEAMKIISHFNNEDYYEELGATVDGKKYELNIIDKSDWIDEGKYQCHDATGMLYSIAKNGSVTKYDIAVTQYVSRSGSYFSEYNYEYEPLEVRRLIQKTIPKQVIPERTVVTFAEEE